MLGRWQAMQGTTPSPVAPAESNAGSLSMLPLRSPGPHPPCLSQATPHQGKALISAPWPSTEAAVDEAATAQFETLQAAVRAVRNARAEYGVEPGRKVAATFRVASSELRAALQAEAPVLALLARLDPEQVSFVGEEEGAALTGQAGQIELVVREGVEAFLPMAGLFDAGACGNARCAAVKRSRAVHPLL